MGRGRSHIDSFDFGLGARLGNDVPSWRADPQNVAEQDMTIDAPG